MAFARELDSLDAEVRRGQAGTISFWPKVDGSNVEASVATYEVKGPSGLSLHSGSATITAVGAVSRLDAAVPAQTDLDTGYRVEFTWRETGGSFDRFAEVLFDVVVHPWVHSETISLNDLLETRPDIGESLNRIGVRLGYTTGDEAKENAAAIAAERARVMLDAWLRNSATESGDLRPALVVDRRALSRVERPLALAAVYESIGKDPLEGEGETDALYRHFMQRAREEYAALRLRYDADEDGTPETTIEGLGTIIRTVRVQG